MGWGLPHKIWQLFANSDTEKEDCEKAGKEVVGPQAIRINQADLIRGAILGQKYNQQHPPIVVVSGDSTDWRGEKTGEIYVFETDRVRRGIVRLPQVPQNKCSVGTCADFFQRQPRFDEYLVDGVEEKIRVNTSPKTGNLSDIDKYIKGGSPTALGEQFSLVQRLEEIGTKVNYY